MVFVKEGFAFKKNEKKQGDRDDAQEITAF